MVSYFPSNSVVLIRKDLENEVEQSNQPTKFSSSSLRWERKPDCEALPPGEGKGKGRNKINLVELTF